MASLVIKIIIIQIVIRSIEDQASLVTMGKNLSENNFLTDIVVPVCSEDGYTFLILSAISCFNFLYSSLALWNGGNESLISEIMSLRNI